MQPPVPHCALSGGARRINLLSTMRFPHEHLRTDAGLGFIQSAGQCGINTARPVLCAGSLFRCDEGSMAPFQGFGNWVI